MALLLAAPAAFAQDATVTTRDSGWGMECITSGNGAAFVCASRYTRELADSDERLVELQVVPPGSSGIADPLVRLSLPHGIRLDARVGLRVDRGEQFLLPLQRSDARGLYTTLPLGADVLRAMKAGGTLTVSLALVEGAVLPVEIPLVGFARAYDAALRVQAEPAPR